MKVLKKDPIPGSSEKWGKKEKNHQIFYITKVGAKKKKNPKPFSIPERKVCAPSQGTRVTIL